MPSTQLSWVCVAICLGCASCVGCASAQPKLVAKTTTLVPVEAVEPVATPDSVASPVALVANVEDEFAASSMPAPVVIDEVAAPVPCNALSLNLPTALAMIGGDHPAVGAAQWRVREAYAALDQAKVLWLPSIQAGFSFHRHDGNYQASNGDIVDVDRNSFQYGLGNSATGAGTTQVPGVIAQFHFADAIFEPEIAKHRAWANQHAATATINDQLRDVALAYNEWLRAIQAKQVLIASQAMVDDLAKLTRDFAEAGQGLRADADRMETETAMVATRVNLIDEAIDVAAVRLNETLSINAGVDLVPMDTVLLPIALVPVDIDRAGLIQTGLMMRPELKQSQNLVAAACEEYRRQKYSPFVPSVLLGLSTGGFGGGLGNELDDVDGRYDLDAAMTWRVRNLGFGESASRRRAASQVQTARYEKLALMDQIASQVDQAHVALLRRRERIAIAETAIESARNSYERNVSRIRDGQGLPIEALQSLRALEDAQRAYLDAIADHNQSQYQLQYALGWSVGGQ